MAPLVVHEEEEGEDGDDEARDDEHHHHQPAVHVLLFHLQSLGRSYITATAECWPVTVEISIQSCWGFYKVINKNHSQQYIFSKDRSSVILQSIEQEEETFNSELVL